jgi:hypothetical protein
MLLLTTPRRNLAKNSYRHPRSQARFLDGTLGVKLVAEFSIPRGSDKRGFESFELYDAGAGLPWTGRDVHTSAVGVGDSAQSASRCPTPTHGDQQVALTATPGGVKKELGDVIVHGAGPGRVTCLQCPTEAQRNTHDEADRLF